MLFENIDFSNYFTKTEVDDIDLVDYNYGLIDLDIDLVYYYTKTEVDDIDNELQIIKTPHNNIVLV